MVERYKRRPRKAEQILDALYTALAGGSGGDVPIPLRVIAAAAGASPSSVGATIERLRELGLLHHAGGGEWVAQPAGRPGLRLPYRYRPQWPPVIG